MKRNTDPEMDFACAWNKHSRTPMIIELNKAEVVEAILDGATLVTHWLWCTVGDCKEGSGRFFLLTSEKRLYEICKKHFPEFEEKVLDIQRSIRKRKKGKKK